MSTTDSRYLAARGSGCDRGTMIWPRGEHALDVRDEWRVSEELLAEDTLLLLNVAPQAQNPV